MPIKKYKPITPSRRELTTNVFRGEGVTEPPKQLLGGLNAKSGGRNNNGRMTARRRGGGHRRLYRIVDFRRDKDNIPAKVIGIQYDPNRSARLALLCYADGEKRFILAANKVQLGDEVMSGDEVEVRAGNHMPISRIPLGALIHNLELKVGKGGQVIRSAGAYGQVMAKEGAYALIKLPSGTVYRVSQRCRATLGQVGNTEHEQQNIGKAGRSRWLGKRPKVRGVVMNPVDHPHGGGEGRSSGGRHPCTPWGVPTKGYRTRKNKRTDKWIARDRRK